MQTPKTPHWIEQFPPLPTAAEMHSWDTHCVSLGIPEKVLMEQAAQAALTTLQDTVSERRELRERGKQNERGERHNFPSLPSLRGLHVCILMGSGNNGGDAACLARRLLGCGALPLVLHTRPLRAYTGVTGYAVHAARACGVQFLSLGAQPAKVFATLGSHPQWQNWGHAPVLVDGLLGTGFSGTVRPPMLALIEAVNLWVRQRQGHSFVLALDIPSGLDATTGTASPMAIQAHCTVTFQAAKAGMLLPTAQAYTGRLRVMDIGIPPCAQTAFPPSFRLLDSSCASLVRRAPVDCYKNSFGHVVVIGGAAGLEGAAHLAARAALRAGAGLVTVVTPAAPVARCATIKGAVPDIMTLPLTEHSQWPQILPTPMLELLQRASAIIIGPGMGRGPDAAACIRAVLGLANRPPAIVDADALHQLPLHLLTHHDVATPHAGEAAVLCGVNNHDIQADRVASIRQLCRLAPAVWVLKGAGTLIAQYSQSQITPILVSPHAVPALAVGGTGDVLCGCIAALVSRLRGQESDKPHAKADASQAAALGAAAIGVVLHVRAGMHVTQDFPNRGNFASEVADACGLHRLYE